VAKLAPTEILLIDTRHVGETFGCDQKSNGLIHGSQQQDRLVSVFILLMLNSDSWILVLCLRLVPCTLCHMALEQAVYFVNSNVRG
jgi:hypothetical protein